MGGTALTGPLALTGLREQLVSEISAGHTSFKWIYWYLEDFGFRVCHMSMSYCVVVTAHLAG